MNGIHKDRYLSLVEDANRIRVSKQDDLSALIESNTSDRSSGSIWIAKRIRIWKRNLRHVETERCEFFDLGTMRIKKRTTEEP